MSYARCLLLLAAASVLHAAPPGEISGLGFQADGETIEWTPEPLATHYNLYRGYLHELAADFYGTTFEAEIVGTSVVEPTPPAPGRGFFYIVTAANGEGEGTMGGRPNNHPWPGYAVAGRWDGPRSWPAVPIHSVILHTGQSLTWQGGGAPTTTWLWDPQTDQFESHEVLTDLFCSGHSLLEDGRVLATGGTVPLFNGRLTSWLFDPAAPGWVQGPTMRHGRYYPSSVTMGDGQVAVFGGNREDGTVNPEVEVFDGRGQGTFDYIIGADKAMILYPAMHLLPDGKIFHSGPEQATETFDVGTGNWQFVANSNFGQRAGGSGQFGSVALPPGHRRIMIFGGNLPGSTGATNTAEIIDLAAPSPAWSYTAPMTFPRRHPDHVILPNGTLLVSGGGYDEETASHAAEIFDPATDSWTVAAMMRSFRLYHSTAVLLPDGRVMAGGSNDNPTMEFYSPGYLFRGPRPVIDSAPASARYGRDFTIDTADAASITSVVLIRPSAATHSKNMSQRYVDLSFTSGAGSLTATVPSNADEAPPGYYMLFIVDGDGVPSVASFIQIKR